jgi:hypothetical protein
MTRRSGSRPRIEAARAIALTGLGVLAAAVTWRLRPGTTVGSATPDGAVVWGCAWLAWLLAGYLAVATTAAALGHLLARLGRLGQGLTRVAPRRLRRLVDTAITTTVTATILSTAAAVPATAAAPPTVVTARAPLVAGSPLDWPGLTSASPRHHPTPDPRHDPDRHGPNRHPAPRRHHHPPADVGLVSGDPSHARQSPGVVVQAGDTLWRIAARELGPGASGAAITEAWHAWYHANRDVIGPNPSVIRPGQHLQPPGPNRAPSAQPTGIPE